MPHQTAQATVTQKPGISPATFIVVVAMLLVVMLSAVTLSAASREASAEPVYDPSISFLGLTDPD